MVELQRIDRDIRHRETIENGYEEIRKILRPGASTKVVKLANKMLE